MTDREWWKSIQDEPLTALHCLGYRDWILEREGETTFTSALQMMARHGWRPGHRDFYHTTRYLVPSSIEWMWHMGKPNDSASVAGWELCRLPDWLFLAVTGQKARPHRYYPGWDAAVDALGKGIRLVRSTLEVL